MKQYRRIYRWKSIRRKQQRDEKAGERTGQTVNNAQALAARLLTSPRVPAVQRQQLAAEIGEAHGNRQLQQIVSLQRSGDPAQEGAVASMEAKEELLEHLSNEFAGNRHQHNSGEEAVKNVAKAALETKTGKQIKKKVKRFLFSRQGIPVSIMLGTTGVAALIANQVETPSIPIPLSDNMELTIDIEGPLNKPKGAIATFKLTF